MVQGCMGACGCVLMLPPLTHCLLWPARMNGAPSARRQHTTHVTAMGIRKIAMGPSGVHQEHIWWRSPLHIGLCMHMEIGCTPGWAVEEIEESTHIATMERAAWKQTWLAGHDVRQDSPSSWSKSLLRFFFFSFLSAFAFLSFFFFFFFVFEFCSISDCLNADSLLSPSLTQSWIFSGCDCGAPNRCACVNLSKVEKGGASQAKICDMDRNSMRRCATWDTHLLKSPIFSLGDVTSGPWCFL